MRARRFWGLTLAVAAAHIAAWQAAAPRLPRGAGPGAHTGESERHVAWLANPRGPARGAAPPLASQAEDATSASPREARTHDPSPPLAATAPGPEAGRRPGPAARPAHAPPAAKRPPAPAALHGQGAGAAAPWPVYATRPPPSARLAYRLLQTNPAGPLPPGRAALSWERDADAFSLPLAVSLPGRPPREWESQGGFDRAGVAPGRLAQRDRGRVTRVIEFDRARALVGPAGAAGAMATAPGVQDRWSWIVQLAAIAEADPRQLRAAHVQVAGLRGELERWTFRTAAPAALPPTVAQQVPAAWRAAPLLHLVREAERPFDLRVELWVGPATHYLPVALRLGTPPGGWSFEMWLESADAAPAAPS
jgi:hypothetical protein